ncbi:MAG: enoyl-CoA hydratase [Chloroflexi bacterium]|nr:MAG: enoyl-CoA hydratase [Chloroflexota bacterium]
MGEYQFVKTAVEDRVAVLTIDHPPANAFDTQTVLDLEAAFNEMTNDENVKVIIITGAGQFFVAGADINEIRALKSPEEAFQVTRKGQLLFSQIDCSKKPVIAAINGRACLGGGLELAMACHIRIAEDSVQIGQPEIKLGIMPGWGGTQRLPRIVGKGIALEMLLTGEPVKAQEAYRIGLVNRVVPVGTVVREAKRWAKVLSTWSAGSLGAILQSVNQGLDLSLETGLEKEAELFSKLTATEDMHEGIAAYFEKRRPIFKDR